MPHCGRPRLHPLPPILVMMRQAASAVNTSAPAFSVNCSHRTRAHHADSLQNVGRVTKLLLRHQRSQHRNVSALSGKRACLRKSSAAYAWRTLLLLQQLTFPGIDLEPIFSPSSSTSQALSGGSATAASTSPPPTPNSPPLRSPSPRTLLLAASGSVQGARHAKCRESPHGAVGLEIALGVHSRVHPPGGSQSSTASHLHRLHSDVCVTTPFLPLPLSHTLTPSVGL